jgi:Acetyltransferase (GNAT) domain
VTRIRPLTLDEDRIIGRVTLSNVVRGPFQSCNLGYWMSRADNGRGHASAAVADMAELAFSERRAGNWSWPSGGERRCWRYALPSFRSASPNGLPSESRQMAHLDPGWITLPPSSFTRFSATSMSSTAK